MKPFRLPALAVAIAALGASVAAQNITTQEVAAGLSDPSRWITYSGDYTGQRHSPLKEITPANAAQLAPQWTFQTGGVQGQFEATPVLLNGVIYMTGPMNYAWALDAKTGKQIWQYKRTLPAGTKVCCGPVNRGFAVFGDRLYMTTLDAHLLALDMKSGKVVWDIELADFQKGYASTVAPLVVKDKLIVGMAGGEYANRGFLDAYDPVSGERIWRFWTVPAPGEPGSETWPAEVLERGGAPTWVTGVFDPELNTLYWGTGNPNPDWDGTTRPGDNLYAASLLALDPDTGKLKWHFQFTPHDTHDWDANQTPVLADLTIAGRPRKVIMQANRNGFLYVLDRTDGTFINGWAYGNQNWASGFTPAGKPIELPGHEPTPEGTVTCPDLYGNTNFMPPSFDKTRGLFFLTVRETCAKYISRPPADVKVGDRTLGGTVQPLQDPPRTGALRAIDPVTGERKWEVKYDGPGWAGVASTEGGVVFSANHEGLFMAVDASNGKVLYTYPTGGTIFAPPTTFQVDGRQYVIVPAATTLTAFALPESARPKGSR
jgi:alcohol dehydrogenase (cytochrome c)